MHAPQRRVRLVDQPGIGNNPLPIEGPKPVIGSGRRAGSGVRGDGHHPRLRGPCRLSVGTLSRMSVAELAAPHMRVKEPFLLVRVALHERAVPSAGANELRIGRDDPGAAQAYAGTVVDERNPREPGRSPTRSAAPARTGRATPGAVDPTVIVEREQPRAPRTCPRARPRASERNCTRAGLAGVAFREPRREHDAHRLLHPLKDARSTPPAGGPRGAVDDPDLVGRRAADRRASSESRAR